MEVAIIFGRLQHKLVVLRLLHLSHAVCVRNGYVLERYRIHNLLRDDQRWPWTHVRVSIAAFFPRFCPPHLRCRQARLRLRFK